MSGNVEPGYLAELRAQWRSIASAFIGMASGIMIFAFVLSIMGPHMIRDLGWGKAELAATGALSMVTLLAFPIIGRLGDLVGTRGTALVGVIVFPLSYLSLSQMKDFETYLIIITLLFMLSGTTTPVIYCRVIVQNVKRARGLALALAASGPALTGLIGAPLLSSLVSTHGWRAGYVAMMIFSLVAGLIAIALMSPDAAEATPGTTKKKRSAKADYAVIFRMRATWILLGAMILCHIPHSVFLPQMGLILQENGLQAAGVGIMISTYAVGTLAGRMVFGLALDRFSPVAVTVIGMSLTAFGDLLIATGFDAWITLWFAILFIGIAFGAETDVLAFLIMRYFGIRIYSTVFGLASAAVSIGCAVGATLAGVIVQQTGLYAMFMWVASGCVATGSLLLLLLPRNPVLPEFDDVIEEPIELLVPARAAASPA